MNNILGTPLEDCCTENHTGFFRNGRCDCSQQDPGKHTVCAVMDEFFLSFSQSRGNDLSTPRPELNFPGLKPGDKWCICMNRWLEALEAGLAPKIYPRSCHESMLEAVELEVLLQYAISDG